MKLRTILTICLLAAFAIAASGCKSKADRVCEHAVDLMVEEGLVEEGDAEDELAGCQEDIVGDAEEQCGDQVGEYYDCVLDADSLEGFGECQSVCEEEGGE